MALPVNEYYYGPKGYKKHQTNIKRPIGLNKQTDVNVRHRKQKSVESCKYLGIGHHQKQCPS